MARALAKRRRESITKRLRENGFVRSSELSSEFGVSVVTIRQDLVALHEQGLAQPTYGGAVYRSETSIDSPFDSRAQEHADAKGRIGEAAAQFIRPGETVILDAGTTTLEIARRLPENADLTVITCALNIALEAGAKPGVTVIQCGGRLNPRTLAVVGRQAERAFAEICADRLFLATYGVDLQKGLAERTFEGAELLRALIAAAREVVLVCDSSKFGAKGPVVISALEAISHVVTDVGIPLNYLQWFESRQVPVKRV